MQIRLMTYNIHKGIGGVDRRYAPDRIVEAIGHCQPDVVFLQEVDEGVPRSRRHRQVDLLGDALGFEHRAYQRNVTLTEGHYGNAILSRFPLDDTTDVNLTIPLKKKRQALVTHCRIPTSGQERTLLLANVHLGLAGFERRMQIRKLLECDLLRRSDEATGVLLGGDFNDVWANLGSALLEPVGFRLCVSPLQNLSGAAAATSAGPNLCSRWCGGGSWFRVANASCAASVRSSAIGGGFVARLKQCVERGN